MKNHQNMQNSRFCWKFAMCIRRGLFAVSAKQSNLIVVGFLELKHYPKQFWDDGAEINEGSNIIGIYPGTNYGTRSTTPQFDPLIIFICREDKILVVGAHWDTTGFTDGYNDNGSGWK